MKSLILALFVGLSIGVNAQDDQGLYKEKVFDHEVGDNKYTSRSSHSSLYVHTAAQQVPAWFSAPPASSDNFVYSIGVSDPGLDSADAMEMALYRAEMMACIFWNSTTQLLCDFYMDEVSNSQKIAYEHFSRINGRIPKQKGTYELIEKQVNAFDEIMVLIKYTPVSASAADLYDVQLELYKNETQASAFGEFESIYEAKIKERDAKEALKIYRFTELGKRYDVENINDGKEVPVPIYTLGYNGITPIDTIIATQYFSHGLWKEYLKSVMTVIINKAREKPENVSYLSDSYQVESYQKLTRGISVNKMRFALVGIKAGYNEMKVELEELPLK